MRCCRAWCARKRSGAMCSSRAAPSSAAASIRARVRSARSSRSPATFALRAALATTGCSPSTRWSTCSGRCKGSTYATPPDAAITGTGSLHRRRRGRDPAAHGSGLAVADEPPASLRQRARRGRWWIPRPDRRRDLEERQGLLRHGDARRGQGGAAPRTRALSRFWRVVVALLGIAARRTHRLR